MVRARVWWYGGALAGRVSPPPVTHTSHSSHSEARVDDDVPLAQTEQFTANPSENVPGAHEEQVVALTVRPVKKPGPHSKQAST